MRCVSLVTLIRDPKGVFLEPLDKFLPILKGIYAEIMVIAARDAHKDVIKKLERHGCIVKPQERNGIAEARRQALRDGFTDGHKFIHLCEIDRLMTWVSRYPNELKSVVQQIPDHNFLILGRTERAFYTHPKTQTETECLANTVCSLLLGRDLDITGGSRGISKEAANLILEYSKTKGYAGSDAEWPIIIHCKSNMSIGYLQVEGLEFETGIKHPKEIEEAGGYEKWKEQIEHDPQIWLNRIKTCYHMVNTAINTYNELASTPKQV